MNKRIVLTALFCITVTLSSLLPAIEQVSTERIAQCQERLKSRIYYMKLVRVAAAVGVLGLGAYWVKLACFDSGSSQITGLTPQEIGTLLAKQEKRICSLEKGIASADVINVSLLEKGGRLLTSIKNGFFSVANLLGVFALNLIAGETLSYAPPAISALVAYPGSALRFYTIHARIPEILHDYRYYAKILTQEHVYNAHEVEYASLYFLNEYTEIIYRIEQLLAYILTIGERDSDTQQDSRHLVEHLTFKTNQLVCSLYACGMGNCPQNMVEKIKAFETELSSTIRLCQKRL